MILIFYNDNIFIYENKAGDINLVKKKDNELVKTSYIKKDNNIKEEILVAETINEFDIFKDKEYNLYLTYQDENNNLFFSNKDEKIKLNNENISKALYLSLFVDEDIYHIFYYNLIDEKTLRYRLYHNIYKDSKWSTYIIDEFNIKILKPIILVKGWDKLYLAYHKWDKREDIFICQYDLEDPLWGNIKRLTNDESGKLNYDLIYKDNKLHLVYTRVKDENYTIMYERFSLDGDIENELKEEITLPSNNDHPILVYFYDLLWISWIYHGNVQSAYSKDFGFSWSNNIKWDEYKGKEIVKYNYLDKYMNKNIVLNKSFGFIKDEIKFIGFDNKENLGNLNYVSSLNKKDMFKADKDEKSEEIYLTEKIIKMRKEIKLLEEKIEHIEDFLSKRARGYKSK